MGNTSSRSATSVLGRKMTDTGRRSKKATPPNAEASRMLFLLYLIHRTWNVIVEHVDSKSNGRSPTSHSRYSSDDNTVERLDFDTVSFGGDSNLGSQYSFCSCSYCRLRSADCGISDCASELTYRAGGMVGGIIGGNRNTEVWRDNTITREKQRPPIYNAEDYAVSLRKWCKRQPVGYPTLYGGLVQDPVREHDLKTRSMPSQGKDYRNPCLSPGEEMSLRQFGTIGELLTKLRADLKLAFPSFVQEFVSDPLDGVTLLLELLRNIQLSQAPPPPPPASAAPGAAPQAPRPARVPAAVQRRALLDELACLQCISYCLARYNEAARRLASTGTLYTLAACIMSSVHKSRVIALQLLAKACQPPANSHNAVNEALSALRLRFGEPVRFRFLVGMLQSTGSSGSGAGDLRVAGMAFLNSLLESAPGPQRRLYLQAELEQAGLDVVALRKMLSKNSTSSYEIIQEINRYEGLLIDVDTLNEKASEAQKEKDDLKNKLELLEKKVQILQEEKGILLSLEQCLKERCCELQEEVTSLRSENGTAHRKNIIAMKPTLIRRDESSPPEDEGISSSERSLSPEDDMQREPLVYEVFNIQNETILMHKKNDIRSNVFKNITSKRGEDEENETTIEEVIEELRNIVNDAESEQNSKDKKPERLVIKPPPIQAPSKSHRVLEKKDSVTSILIMDNIEYPQSYTADGEESEIIPTKIFPHPPRRAKSLVHLFVPPVEENLINIKQRDTPFEDEHMYYSSDEGSDSLLSASCFEKPVNQVTTENGETCITTNNRALLNTIMDARERAIADKREHIRRIRAKSGNDINRKHSINRSESYKQLHQKYNVVGPDNIKVGRDNFDGLFFVESQNSSPYIKANNGPRTEHQSHHQARQQDDINDINALIEAKKLTKSLDRIDEGLDSMVDIVMTSEKNKSDWPFWSSKYSTKSKTKSDLEKNFSLGITNPTPKHNTPWGIPYRHISVDSQSKENSIRDDVIPVRDAGQSFYLTKSKMSQSSYENSNSVSNMPLIIKRGQTNAGLYSGKPLRSAAASMMSLGTPRHHGSGSLISNGHADKRGPSPSGSRSISTHTPKVTDMISGLY